MTSVIQDWIVEIDVNTTKAEKKLARFEQRMKKLVNMQAKLDKGFSGGVGRQTSSRQTGQRSTRQEGFKLTDDRQLKLFNTIESVVRRARTGLGESSKEFQRINASAKQLQSNISKINSKVGLEKLNNEIRILRERTTQATSAIRQQNAAMTRQKFVAKGVTDSLRNMARSYVSVFAAIEGGRGALNIGKGFEDMSSTMLLASGSAKQSAKDFEFLVGISRKMGLEIGVISKSFAKFAVAGRASGLTTGETKQAFEELAVTFRATGLNAERTNLSFLAMQQMLSNGVVSMQELKLQLGEQLPQTMEIAEKALRNLGHTSGSVKEIISSGNVESASFVREFSKLAAEQAKTTGAYSKSIKSMTAAQGRFNTELELTVNQLFEGGGKEGIVSIFDGLAKVLKSLGPFLKAAGSSLKEFGQLFGTQLKIYSGVVNIFTSLFDVVDSLVSLIPGLGRTVGDAEGQASGLLKVFNGVFEVAKKIQAIIQLTVGFIERLARGDSLTSIVNELLKIRGSGAEVTGPGFLARQIPVLGTLMSTGSSIAARAAASGSGASKVNSDNTLNATINVPSGDPAIVRETMDMWWQDTMKKGI